MERLSGSGSLPDYESDRGGGGGRGVPQSVTNIVDFSPFMLMLLFSCHSLTTSSSAFVLIFFPLRPSVSFPLPSLRGGSQQGSVLIRPGKRSGDNRPAADIRHCALPLPGSRAVGVSRRSR